VSWLQVSGLSRKVNIYKQKQQCSKPNDKDILYDQFDSLYSRERELYMFTYT